MGSKKRTLLWWSSGKDSAWALQQLSEDPKLAVLGLITTINEEYQRVAMHGVRIDLLRRQADSLGLPLHVWPIPNPCTNEQYEAVVAAILEDAGRRQIQCMAFGDLFLDDVRAYRERILSGSDLEPVFPLWGLATEPLARLMVAQGVRARVATVDTRQLSAEFAGRMFDNQFLDDLPSGVDPCGEYGEFHTFVYDAPLFRKRLAVRIGDTVQREGFAFTDLIPEDSSND